MKLTTWKQFLKGMFLTTIILLGSTVIIAVSIDTYPTVHIYGKGVLIVACLVALASVYRVGDIWLDAAADYKAEGDSEK